jgi:maleylacetoacetate isomerase/maleylpyruvate isomerase
LPAAALFDAMLTHGDGFGCGIGAALRGEGRDLAAMKRGHNLGYHRHPIAFPRRRRGAGIMTNGEAGLRLAGSLRRSSMRLYTYFRSSAAYRVRIALNLKGVAYESVAVHLVKGRDGLPENRLPEYRAVNPQMRVPALRTDGGDILLQSPAILEWLEETHPSPPLLPRDPLLRARVRAIAAIICCDIHPLNNSSTLARLRQEFGADETKVNAWVAHWIKDGFTAIEDLITPGPYAFGPRPSLADVCLVPQVFNARRFNVPLDDCPKIVAVNAAMQTLDAVKRAAPAAQPDAE